MSAGLYFRTIFCTINADIVVDVTGPTIVVIQFE
jgi:hypothetical protein